MFFFLKISDLKISFFRSFIAYLLLKKKFNVQFLPTVSIYSSANSLENKETYQLDGVKLTQHFIL